MKKRIKGQLIRRTYRKEKNLKKNASFFNRKIGEGCKHINKWEGFKHRKKYSFSFKIREIRSKNIKNDNTQI